MRKLHLNEAIVLSFLESYFQLHESFGDIYFSYSAYPCGWMHCIMVHWKTLDVSLLLHSRRWRASYLGVGTLDTWAYSVILPPSGGMKEGSIFLQVFFAFSFPLIMVASTVHTHFVLFFPFCYIYLVSVWISGEGALGRIVWFFLLLFFSPLQPFIFPNYISYVV